jgi:hypothetical protein
LTDFIKVNITELNPSLLEENPLLMFEQRNISNEGFLFPKLDKNNKNIKDKNGNDIYKTPYKISFYNSLEFRIYESGRITMSGSLHKYWNNEMCNGAHNFNDFDYKTFLFVLNDLKHKFSIPLKNCVLKSLEVGINIIPTIPTNQFLDYCFLHKTKQFEWQKNSNEGKYKQVEHIQYIIKIYNKALHYQKDFDIKTEIMRFEIKYIKMQKINERGIYNLMDLANYGLYNFKDVLLNEFNNILYYDNTIQSESHRISNYRNLLYWVELLNKPTKTSYYKHREILKNLTSECSNKIQNQIAEIIKDKIDFLTESFQYY